MGLISNIKYKYGLSRLRKDFRKPENNAVVCNIENAQSLGIIYNATKEEDFIRVKEFLHRLKKTVPEVVALGFVDMKELANFHIQPLDFSFFCHKDLNWYHKPAEDSVEDFVRKKFDILIDLNLTENLSVRFVLAESAALFKTGRFCKIEPNYYDLMISLNEQSSGEEVNQLEMLIKQTELYLKMIKPS